MKLTKNKKIFIGILTLWPILYMFLFIFFVFGMIFIDMHSPNIKGPPASFSILFALHFFTIIYMFALIGFYIYYLFKTDRVPKDKKALWAVVIFLGNMFAMPVFWFLYIWKETDSSTS